MGQKDNLINNKTITTIKILDLPLKKEWYDMIERGEKTEEYREIKTFWVRRLMTFSEDGDINIRSDYTHVRFRYGYTKRTMLFELKEIDIDWGNPDWGAPEEMCFVLKFNKNNRL